MFGRNVADLVTKILQIRKKQLQIDKKYDRIALL